MINKKYLQLFEYDFAPCESYRCIAHFEFFNKFVIAYRRHDPFEGLVKGCPMCFFRETLIIKHRSRRISLKVIISH